MTLAATACALLLFAGWVSVVVLCVCRLRRPMRYTRWSPKDWEVDDG